MSRTSLREASVELHPTADSSDNNQIYDAVGNKTDASVTTIGETASQMAYIKGILKEALEIERHFHGNERWFGLAVSGEATATHKADSIDDYANDNVVAPFQIVAGNDNWGSWVQILGSGDTPFADGMVKFDLHKLGIVDSGATNVHAFIQIGSGASGQAALDAKTYTTIQYLTPTNQAAEAAISFMDKRKAVGSLMWARCLGVGDDGLTLDFYFGLHEYET